MTQEHKQLLLKDLCARVPYEVQCEYTSVQPGLEIHNEIGTLTSIDVMHNNIYNFKIDNHLVGFSDFKPFLRPMSSMTEEEKKEFQACHCVYELHPDFQPMMCNLANELNMFDWLNAHHFDYRGLIYLGLALEAPKDMYKTE